jgi:hypothetical protein
VDDDRALHQLQVDGVSVDAETVAALSPYIRTHINRFGRYELDLNRRPPAIDYDLAVFANDRAPTTAPSLPSDAPALTG